MSHDIKPLGVPLIYDPMRHWKFRCLACKCEGQGWQEVKRCPRCESLNVANCEPLGVS